jgi:adenylosuccinate synthase
MKKGKLNIVFGGMAGSEAKGKLSGWLVENGEPDAIVMTSSPNAGHTIILPDGTKKVSYHLPIGAVMSECPILLGPASLINHKSFSEEIVDLGIDPGRIIIDPRASVIHEYHIGEEEREKLSDIGSTLQGIGSCRRGKLERKGRSHHTLVHHIADMFAEIKVHVAGEPIPSLINRMLDDGATLLAESTQGFDLDLEHGIDPVYCTSKMINPSMVAAEAGVAPSMVGDVMAVIRPYPIRVNNRTGTSGPYAEAEEITWPMVEKRCGCPETLQEITTTTKLPRRVFEFSWSRFRHMVAVCRPTAVCLQFANYLDWGCYDQLEGDMPPAVEQFVTELESLGPQVRWIGTGPGSREMIYRGDA